MTDDAILKAQNEIAAILAKLETDTGSVVDRLEVRDIEVTNIDSVREEWVRSVIIEMKRLPGTQWHKA